jgi:hypothetical protein
VTITRQHGSDRGHRLAVLEPDLEGRGHDHFSGHATDAQDGTLPASALTGRYPASLLHTNRLPYPPDPDEQRRGGGSFTAPDHEYPCWLEVQLTATDSGGLCRPQVSG